MLLPRMFASFAVASALLLVTPSLSAQVSAPTQDEGGGIAPPGGGGNTSGSGTVISGGGALPTPSGASIDMAPPMTLEPTPSSSGGLASLRGDQALTASALMGSPEYQVTGGSVRFWGDDITSPEGQHIVWGDSDLTDDYHIVWGDSTVGDPIVRR